MAMREAGSAAEAVNEVRIAHDERKCTNLTVLLIVASVWSIVSEKRDRPAIILGKGCMLKSLNKSQVEAIIEAAVAKAADSAAMEKYLYSDQVTLRSHSASDLAKEAAMGVYESSDQLRVTHLVSSLDREARTELIALIWLGRGTEIDFQAALKTARRNVPEAAQVAYITAKPLQIYLPKGLKKIQHSDPSGQF